MKLVSLLDIHLVQKFNQAYIKCQLKKMKMWANEVAPWIPSPESTWCRERADTFKLSSGLHMCVMAHAHQHTHINKISKRKMKCVFLSTQLINSASRAVWFFFFISVWKIKPWCEGLVYKYSYSCTHLLPLIRRWPLDYQMFFLEDLVTVLPVKQYRPQELYNMLFIVVIGKSTQDKDTKPLFFTSRYENQRMLVLVRFLLLWYHDQKQIGEERVYFLTAYSPL